MMLLKGCTWKSNSPHAHGCMFIVLCCFMIIIMMMNGTVRASWNERDATRLRNRFVANMTRHHAEFIGKFPEVNRVDVSSFPIILDERSNQILSVYWNLVDHSERLIAFDVLSGGKTMVSSFEFPKNFSRLNENRPITDNERSFMYLPRIWNHKIWHVLKIDTSKNYETFGKVVVMTGTASETEIVDLAIDNNSILYVSYKDKISAFNMSSPYLNGQLMWTVFNYDQNTIEFGNILLSSSSIFVSNIQRSPSQINPFHVGLIEINRMGVVIHRTVFNPSLATKTPLLPNHIVNLDDGYILTSHQSSNISTHLTLYHESDISHPVSQFDLRMPKYLNNVKRFECSNILAFTESNDDDNSFSILCTLSETEILVKTVTVLFKFALIDKGSASTRIQITEESIYDSPRFYLCNTQLVTLNHGGGGDDNGDNFNGDYFGFVCDNHVIIYSQSGVGEAASRIILDSNISAFRDMIGAANGMFYLMTDLYLQSLRHNID